MIPTWVVVGGTNEKQLAFREAREEGGYPPKRYLELSVGMARYGQK